MVPDTGNPDYEGLTLILKSVESYFTLKKPIVYCCTRIDQQTVMSVEKHSGKWRLCITTDEGTKPLGETSSSVRIKACKYEHFSSLEKSRLKALSNLVPQVEEAILSAEKFLMEVHSANSK